MKRYYPVLPVLLATLALAGLTACGPETDQEFGGSKSTSASPSPSDAARPVPDVTGMNYAQASKLLASKGFQPTIVGPDGKEWSTMPDSSVLMTATNPTSGTVTSAGDVEIIVNVSETDHAAAVAAAAEAKKLATRYEYSCSEPYDYSTEPDIYHTYQEVWSSPHYTNTNTCNIEIDGVGIYDKPVLIPSEQKIADIIASHGGGGGGSASSDFGRALQLCMKTKPDYADEIIARMDWKKAEAQGAVALCPDAPHIAVLQDVASSVKMGDGRYTVGQTLEAGTYQTKPNLKDCYWSRNTGGGDIIANDFISFAPDGVTVSVFAGEGFESERCGPWTKIG